MKVLLSLLLLFSAEAGSFEIEGVPFVKQESRFCGPASLVSVFGYYGLTVDQDTIARDVYSEKLRGALITDLEDCARSHGFQTHLGRGSTDDIKAALREKKPVIVLVDLGFWVITRPHYLVIIGYSDKGFIAHTGYESGETFPYAEFGMIWAKKGSVYLSVWR